MYHRYIGAEGVEGDEKVLREMETADWSQHPLVLLAPNCVYQAW